MSNNLHPTFQEMFDSFFAPGQAHAASPADSLPPVSQPVERGEYAAHGVPLIVDYINFPIIHGRRDEWGQLMDPDYPAGCEIQAVYHRGEDVYALLSEEIVEALERHFGPSRD